MNYMEQVKKYLTADQYKLYKLIYARAVASLMAPSKSNTVSVVLSVNGYDFNASGTQLAFDGYLKMVSEYETSKDVVLPELSEGQQCTPLSLQGNQHFTEPPLRYSEARLIKEMEEQGIGRPSTYSMIIDTIQQRGYVTLDKATESSKTKVFFPTEQGVLTCEKLDEYFSQIINVKYTANMENELDEIAEGDLDHVKALREFYDQFEPLVDNAYQNMEKMEPEKIGEQCPECGGELLKRKSRYGNYFLGCSNFPKCRHIENIEGEKRPTYRRRGAKKDD